MWILYNVASREAVGLLTCWIYDGVLTYTVRDDLVRAVHILFDNSIGADWLLYFFLLVNWGDDCTILYVVLTML